MAMVTKAHPTKTTRERNPLEAHDVVPQRAQCGQDHQRGHRRQQDLAGLLDAGVAPDAAVEAEDPVGDEVDGQGQDEEHAEVLPVDGGGAIAEVGHLGGAVARPQRR